MRFVLAAVVLSCLPPALVAQGPKEPPATRAAAAEREAVLAVVQRFFDTMASGDTDGQLALFLPDARFFVVQEDKTGAAPSVRIGAPRESIERRRSDKRRLQERMWEPQVLVHDTIAVVWTPYDFWIDGKFSHCGVDAFNLVKTPDGWKMIGGMYTVEMAKCEPSPLGPLKAR